MKMVRRIWISFQKFKTLEKKKNKNEQRILS